MTAWFTKYLGAPWKSRPDPPESFTCGDLVIYAYKQELSISMAEVIANPAILRECMDNFKHPHIYGLRPLALNEHEAEERRAQNPGMLTAPFIYDSPRELDVCYMARVKYFDHVGLAAKTSEGLGVLHCMQGLGTLIESEGELRARGFRHIYWFRHEDR